MLNLAPTENADANQPFSLVASAHDGAVVVTVVGELDSSSAPALRDMFRTIAAGGCQSIIVAMDRVTFVDSAGLSALIAGYKLVDGRLYVRAPSRPAERLLKLTGQYERFVPE